MSEKKVEEVTTQRDTESESEEGEESSMTTTSRGSNTFIEDSAEASRPTFGEGLVAMAPGRCNRCQTMGSTENSCPIRGCRGHCVDVSNHLRLGDENETASAESDERSIAPVLGPGRCIRCLNLGWAGRNCPIKGCRGWCVDVNTHLRLGDGHETSSADSDDQSIEENVSGRCVRCGCRGRPDAYCDVCCDPRCRFQEE
jgi:hypothetical protein